MNIFPNTISGRLRSKKVIVTLISIFILIYILAPIYWVIVSSFQKEAALMDRPPHLFPNLEIFTLNHSYEYIFTGVVPPDSTVMLQSMYTMSGTLVYPAIINSIIIAIFVTLINILIGFPAGHVFARYRFYGDRRIFLGLLATRLLPSISIVIPMYILLLKFNLLDTKIALVGIYTAITLPFTIWIMRVISTTSRLNTK